MKWTRPCARHLVDHGQVAVRIVQDGARLDALARDLHGVVVGQQLAGIVGRVAEMRRRHQPQHLRNFAARVDRRSGEVAAAGDANADVVEADVAGVAPSRRDRSRIGEGQPVLPGKVGAQQVGQVGAVGIEEHAGRIGRAIERIGLGAGQAFVHGAAVAFADALDEFLEGPLVLIGPCRTQHAPGGGRQRSPCSTGRASDCVPVALRGCRQQPPESAMNRQLASTCLMHASPSAEFCYRLGEEPTYSRVDV